MPNPQRPTTTGDTGEQINRKRKPLPGENFTFEMGKRQGYAEGMNTPCPCGKRKPPCGLLGCPMSLLVELSQWSKVAERNGELHARIASALALAEESDYSTTYQDEYQRLWHETAAERDKARHQLAATLEDLDGANALIDELEERVRHLRQVIAGQNPEWRDTNA